MSLYHRKRTHSRVEIRKAADVIFQTINETEHSELLSKVFSVLKDFVSELPPDPEPTRKYAVGDKVKVQGYPYIWEVVLINGNIINCGVNAKELAGWYVNGFFPEELELAELQ